MMPMVAILMTMIMIMINWWWWLMLFDQVLRGGRRSLFGDPGQLAVPQKHRLAWWQLSQRGEKFINKNIQKQNHWSAWQQFTREAKDLLYQKEKNISTFPVYSRYFFQIRVHSVIYTADNVLTPEVITNNWWILSMMTFGGFDDLVRFWWHLMDFLKPLN